MPQITGTNHADYLVGTSGDDTLVGWHIANPPGDTGKPHDNDILYSAEGDDLINGGSGRDRMDGGTGNDLLYGGIGNDVIGSYDGSDTIYAGDGDDDITTGTGLSSALILGEAGDDVFIATSLATSATLDGGDGIDELSLDLSTATIAQIIDIKAGSNPLGGGGMAFVNMERVAYFSWSSLDDTIIGGDYGDWIFGSFGNNLFFGGSGDDTLNGEYGDDRIFGGDGQDSIEGGLGADTLSGGAGDDRIISDSAGGDQIDGGAGIDLLELTLYGNALAAVFSLADPTVQQVLADGTTIVGVEQVTLFGSSLDDSVTGGGFADILHGGSGDDFLAGDAGNDVIYGEAGNDTLLGGDGNDTFYYGPSGNFALTDADQIDGGAGVDYLHLDFWGASDDAFGTDSSLSLSIANPAHSSTLAPGVTIVGIERLWLMGNNAASHIIGGDLRDWVRAAEGSDTIYGGAGNDTLLGEDGNGSFHFPDSELADGDSLFGGDGSDQIFGDAGRDWLSGGDGHDLIHGGTNADWLFGGSGHDTLHGDESGDELTGRKGSDSLDGGGGNDTLWGGGGTDNLTGGTGADSFSFRATPASGIGDTITDFTTGQDQILLLASGFAGLTPGTLPAADFVLGTLPTDASDRILYDATTGFLWYDSDGNGTIQAVQLALLSPGTAFALTDILII